MKQLAWVHVALGVWLMAAPATFGYSASLPVIVENWIPGIFLIASAAWILGTNVDRLEVDWIQELCGLWLIVGSIVLVGANMPPAAANSLIVGLLVLAVDVLDTWLLTRRPETIA